MDVKKQMFQLIIPMPLSTCWCGFLLKHNSETYLESVDMLQPFLAVLLPISNVCLFLLHLINCCPSILSISVLKKYPYWRSRSQSISLFQSDGYKSVWFWGGIAVWTHLKARDGRRLHDTLPESFWFHSLLDVVGFSQPPQIIMARGSKMIDRKSNVTWALPIPHFLMLK